MEKGELAPAVRELGRLLGSRDVQEILDLGREFFGNPIILAGTTFTVLAMTSEPELTARNWTDIRDSGGIPMSAVPFDRLSEVYRRSAETRRPVLDTDAFDGVPMLRKVLCVGDRVLAYMDSPLYYGLPSREDTEFFNLLGELITMQLKKGAEHAAAPDNMLDFFVHDLLGGRITDAALIVERFAFFGWNILARGRIQVLALQRPGGPEWDVPAMHRLITRLAGLFPLCRGFAYGPGVRLICPVTGDLTRDGRFMAALLPLMEERGLAVGASRVMDSVTDICSMSAQAGFAADMGRRLRPGERVFCYDGLAVYRALEICAAGEELSEFCHSAVFTLRAHDAEHGTELLKTLRVYLRHSQSAAESAAELFIHRNTMSYRVAKIKELTGVDFADSSTLCHLLFSCCALDYQEAGREGAVI